MFFVIYCFFCFFAPFPEIKIQFYLQDLHNFTRLFISEIFSFCVNVLFMKNYLNKIILLFLFDLFYQMYYFII